MISPAADFAFSNKTNHLNLNKQEHPFQLKKIPGCESFPSNTLCFQDCPVPIFGMGNGSQWFFSSRFVAFFASVFPPPVLCCCSLVGPCVGWSDFFCCHPRSCQGWFGLVMQLLYTSDQEIYRYKRQCTLLYIITITSIINFLRKRVQNKSTPQKEQKAAETILKTEP